MTYVRFGVAFVCAWLAPFAAAADAAVEFNRDIRPTDKCYTCHGPDTGNRKGSGADRILLKRETMKVHGPALDTSQPAFRWPLVRGRDHHFVLALVLPLQTQLS
jgi:hypothetical protein